MKKLLIAAGAVVFLAGLAFGALKIIGIDVFEEKDAAESSQETPAEGTDTKNLKQNVKSSFVEMEPIVVPLFYGGKVTGNIQLKIQLQVDSILQKQKVMRLLPKISDVFLRDLYDYLPRYLRSNDRINPLDIKQRLMHRLNTSVEEGLVSDITVKTLSTGDENRKNSK
ncbi:MAG: hypothetical protein OEY85_02465 [Rhodospirillales bacterium]|nr:hypothetical protein [Rhodospirillales bacterium]